MAIYDNIKCYHLQRPKKVPRAFFVVATNSGEKAIIKTWFWVMSIVKFLTKLNSSLNFLCFPGKQIDQH